MVIIPSIFGISPDVVKFSEQFAQEGGTHIYVLDSFLEITSWSSSDSRADATSTQETTRSGSRECLFDLIAAIEHGKSEARCNGSVILLGICFGGKFALSAPIQSEIQAVAAWHGGGLLPVLQSEGSFCSTEC